MVRDMNKLDIKKTALIVLDVQNDFCDDEGAFAKSLDWNPKPLQQEKKIIAAKT